MVMRPLAFMEEQRQRFGDVFTVRLLHEPPWTLVSDPELIKRIYKAPPEVLHAGEGKRVLRPVLGESSVLLLDEERHMEQRRLLLPPFGGGHVERYEGAMRTAAERAIEAWPRGTAEAALTWTEAIALETILHAVFGVGDSERLAPLRSALGELQRPGNARESRAPGFREALDRVDRLIFAEIAERASGGTEAGEDVLSLLLEARHEDGSPMSHTEIRDELLTLLIAGHETTAITLAWALELLARHPAELALVEAEAGEGGPHTDAAIRETLRLRPALPVVARAVKEPFELGAHRIPPGTVLIPAILLVHHRADLFPEPHAFRPERFLGRQPDPHTWMPFGGGARRCLGARFALHEMRVILATLLAQATVRPAGERPEAMRFRNITLTPSRGAPLILQSR